MLATHNTVLAFWFNEVDPKQWWKADPAFEELVRQRFGTMLQQAAQGELYRWRNKAKGRLAEAIVLDQFSRNIHRNTPMAFSQDAMALALGQEAITAGSHQSLTATECSFLMLPYMHSKSRLVHAEAERLYREYAPPYNQEFELKHKAIVDRFGRYPHRNGILGRTSPAEEVEFLQQPESGF